MRARLVQQLFDFMLADETPERVIGDKAYDSDVLAEELAQDDIELIAPHRQNRKPEHKTQDGRPLRRYKRRWKVERTIAWLRHYRRLCIRWEKSKMLFQGFLHFRLHLATAQTGLRIGSNNLRPIPATRPATKNPSKHLQTNDYTPSPNPLSLLISSLQMANRPPTLNRWIDIALMAFLGAPPAYLITLTPPFTALHRWLTPTDDWQSGLNATAVFLTAILLTYPPAIRLGAVRLTHLRNPSLHLRYPPAWTAALFGTTIIFATAHLTNPNTIPLLTRAGLTIALICIPTTLLLALLLAHPHFQKSTRRRTTPTSPSDDQTQPTTPTHTTPDITKDPNALDRWLSKERPISRPQDDRFNTLPTARRIARKLHEHPIHTIGLVGPYGSGKSSTLNLVLRYLNTPRTRAAAAKHSTPPNDPARLPAHVWTCNVELWGHTENRSAAQQILTHAVNEIATHLDPTAVATLPTDYANAIANAGSTIGQTATALLGTQDPVALLERLDHLLQPVNARLAIFIEDADRNDPNGTLAAEIESLIDRLRQKLHHVTFVLAAQRAASTDLFRLCTHVETTPTIQPQQAADLLTLFINTQESKFPNNINPNPQPSDNTFAYGEVSDRIQKTTAYPYKQVIVALTKLLDSPRNLKTTLRAACDTWTKLHGEIDLTDLVAATALRHGAPPVFAYLTDHHDQFRMREHAISRSPNNTNIDNEQTAAHSPQQRFNDALTRCEAPPEAIQTLVAYLFPKAETDWRTFPSRNHIPQGVGHPRTARYWRRLLAQELDPDETRDQDVLKDLAVFKKTNDPRPITHKLYHGTAPDGNPAGKTYGETFEHLASETLTPELNLAAHDLRTIASELHKLILADRKTAATLKDAPGFANIFRAAVKKQDNQYIDWIRDELKKAIPHSLSLFNDIRYWWTPSSNFMHASQEDLETLFDDSYQIAKDHFNASPTALPSILDVNAPYAFCHFLLRDEEIVTNGYAWFGQHIYNALQNSSHLITTLLAPLLASEIPSHEHPTGELKLTVRFDEHVLSDLFQPAQLPTIMQALANATTKDLGIRDERISTKITRHISVARTRAKKWLTDNPPPPAQTPNHPTTRDEPHSP